jgi:hypothetical protein
MMLAALRRHPFPVDAHFRYSLVLAYAFPEEALQPFLPPGLVLDSYEGSAFLAIALVQTENLRPSGWPAALGRDFFLSGYRIFARFRRTDGAVLRGLRILRSDTDSRFMAWSGNLLTHYHYRKCTVTSERSSRELAIRIATPDAEADLSVRAYLDEPATAPPPGSPFPDLAVARRFAGPLPFTFDYERESHRMVIIEGVRENWNPTPVRVSVDRCTFFESERLRGFAPRLANAFFLEDIPYRWKRGVVAALGNGQG